MNHTMNGGSAVAFFLFFFADTAILPFPDCSISRGDGLGEELTEQA